jgi:hypothetical protein
VRALLASHRLAGFGGSHLQRDIGARNEPNRDLGLVKLGFVYDRRPAIHVLPVTRIGGKHLACHERVKWCASIHDRDANLAVH